MPVGPTVARTASKPVDPAPVAPAEALVTSAM
jgi:hypothetical protein